jgi:hypothetical protein
MTSQRGVQPNCRHTHTISVAWWPFLFPLALWTHLHLAGRNNHHYITMHYITFPAGIWNYRILVYLMTLSQRLRNYDSCYCDVTGRQVVRNSSEFLWGLKKTAKTAKYLTCRLQNRCCDLLNTTQKHIYIYIYIYIYEKNTTAAKSTFL